MGVSHDKLQEYYDGELDQGDADGIREALETDVAATEELARLKHLSSFITMASEEAAAELDSDALFARVNAGLEGGNARTTEAGGSVIDMFKRKKAVVISSTVLAVAAAFILAYLANTGPDPLITAPALAGSAIEEVNFA